MVILRNRATTAEEALWTNYEALNPNVCSTERINTGFEVL